MTPAQVRALHALWQRNQQGMTYVQFRRTAQNRPLVGCVMVRWCDMWVGIEKDGYTHS